VNRYDEQYADDDPHSDGPTLHVPGSALRSLAVASAAAEDPTEHKADVFSATTRRSPAVYLVEADAQTKRIVSGIWALAAVLLVLLAYLVYDSLVSRS
jgi:hypothetical protein